MELAPLKKKVKQVKGKGREAIKAAGRETASQAVAKGKAADGMSVHGKHEADHGTNNHKTGFMPFLSSMLTLDKSTLFIF